MSIVIDANMRTFADRMDISTTRMVRDYGLKSVEEIIDAEAQKGNSKAIRYAIDLYNSPAKLIKVFRLNDVENKYVLLKHMDDRTRMHVLPLLNNDDLVMGLYFYTQDKILDMLKNVKTFELVNVALNAFNIEGLVNQFRDVDFAMFFMNDKLEKADVLQELQALPPEIMQQFIEGVTGQPAEKTDPMQLIGNIAAMPDDKYRKFMASIDPEVQRQLTLQLTKKKPEYLQLFPNESYLTIFSKMTKQDMVKPMVALQKETLCRMMIDLPDDLLSIVCSQVDTKKFAQFLLDGHHDVLDKALMI